MDAPDGGDDSGSRRLIFSRVATQTIEAHSRSPGRQQWVKFLDTRSDGAFAVRLLANEM